MKYIHPILQATKTLKHQCSLILLTDVTKYKT